jgi:putative nucleotidyltransferase with HDIG domain
VELDLKWFEHPFTFSRFKIKTEEQLATLRSLGLASVRYNPDLSDVRPLPVPAVPSAVPAAAAAALVSPALEEKRAMVERLRVLRESTARVERAFQDTAHAIHDIERNLFARPEESAKQASALVNQIADSILCAPELAIQVMGDSTGGEEMYCHSLNVTMLAMMMARDIKLPQPVAAALGMGALLHDVGWKNLPDKIVHKHEPLTSAEQHLFETHAQHSVEITQKMRCLPAVTALIREHHELFDGSGYPAHLKGEDIGLLARIVAIADHYDELCNPANIAIAMTPHEALSTMFAKHRGKFDPKLLQVFIRCLGVYPPGTIVQLSNGLLGMVSTVNTAKPMKPMLVIYDANVPKNEAIIVNLEREPELNLVKAVRPAQVPPAVYNYLSPRKRVSYYFDAGQPGQSAGAA